MLKDIEQGVDTLLCGINVFGHPSQLFGRVAAQLQEVSIEYRGRAGCFAQMCHLRIGGTHVGRQHAWVRPNAADSCNFLNNACMATTANDADSIFTNHQIQNQPKDWQRKERGDPCKCRIRPGPLDPDDAHTQSDVQHKGKCHHPSEHASDKLQPESLAQELIEEMIHPSVPGRAEGQSQISRISNRFSPLGRSARTVSPTCDFINATPSGLEEVTSM